MSINIQQLILEAQKMANRNKELVALSNSLLVEAESNNRTLEAMRQFQDDMDSLNKLARNKSNSDMINRINQQNPSIRETRNENRELKATLEDHQRVLEMVMQKYREHTQQNVFKSQINFKELYNEKLLEVIRKQAEKINEMAAVMQKAAQADDDDIYKEIEWNIKLKTENQALRELLQIANDFDSTATLRSNEAGGSGGIVNNSDEIIDDDKNNVLLHSHIATSSTSSGYGTIATSSIQSSRILCRSCEDKAIQTELIQQQSIDEQLSQQPQEQQQQQQQQQQQRQQNQKQSESLQSTPNKSLDDDDDDDSVIENKNTTTNLIENDNDKMVLINTMKILNQVLENGNSVNINLKNKNNAPENSEQNSNNNSPNKIQQQQQQQQQQQPQQQQFNENNSTTIKIKKEQNLNNENNKNNIEITKHDISETNLVDINDLSKLNLTNGTVDIIVENNETKQQQQQQQQIQNNDSRLNNSTIEITTTPVKTENQENNNKTTVSS